MLWLPLFTGAALAMSTQMQVANELQEIEKVAQPPCHDMQQMDSKQTSNKHCNGQCFACGVCTLGGQALSFMTFPTVYVPAYASPTPNLPDLAFNSQLYPPALRPPISA